MSLSKEDRGSVEEHPCFSRKAHFQYGRLHLPVAPACNIQCAYCDRRSDCPNESRPGVSSAILTPEQALERVEQALSQESQLRVVGIAGPGDPLCNPAAMETLALVHRSFPHLILCLSTNGLLLPDKMEELREYGVKTLTVTVNALRMETARKLYSNIQYHGKVLPSEEGIPLLLDSQRMGVQRAAAAGIAVKINTVLVPGINDQETEPIAQAARRWGAVLMNLMPLIPQAALSDSPAPTPNMMHEYRSAAAKSLPQFTHCKQCRADACGIPGQEPGPLQNR